MTEMTLTDLDDNTGLLRKKIKDGESVTLTFRGKPVIAAVPMDQYEELVAAAERLAELEAQNEAVPA